MQEPFDLETLTTAHCQRLAKHYQENGLGLQTAAENLQFSARVVDHLAVLVIDEFTAERVSELVAHLRLWDTLALEVLFHVYVSPEERILSKNAISLSSAMKELTERVNFLADKAMGVQGSSAFFRMAEHWILVRSLAEEMLSELAQREVQS